MKNILIMTLASSLVVGWMPTLVRGEMDIQQIAITGQPAPGASDGAEYDSFSFLQLNASNEVAFRAGLRTGTETEVTSINDTGIYRSTTDSVLSPSLLVREGEPVPGASDGVVFDLDTLTPDFAFNSSGDIALVVGLRDGDRVTNRSGIYGPTLGAGSTLGLLARGGDPAPGVLDGAEFSWFPEGTYLSETGDVAFESYLTTGTGEPVRTSGPNRNDRAVFGPVAGPGSALSLILRDDDPAPGASDAAEIDSARLRGLNDDGVLIHAQLRTGAGPPVQDNGVDGSNQAILGPTSSGLGIVIRENDIPSGLSGGAEVNQIFVATRMNAAGDIASTFQLRDETSPGELDYIMAIFGPVAGSGSTPGIVARRDSPAPGTGGALYLNFSWTPTLNSSGDLAFEGWIKTGPGEVVTDGDNNIIFGPVSGVGSPLGLIAREGNTAPGVDDSAQFDNFSAPVLSDNGDLAFYADLQTGDPENSVDSTNDFGLFGYIDGQLELIVRTGELIDVRLHDSVESRTVSGIGLTGTNINDAIVSFNANGLLAFGLEFTDGTSGIFTANTRIASNFDGDFDLDGDVDGADFLVWQRNPNVGSLNDWQSTYPSIAVNLRNSLIVPEPSVLMLGVTALIIAMAMNRPRCAIFLRLSSG